MALSEDNAQWAGKIAADRNEQLQVEQENHQESSHTENEDVIAREVKYPLQNLDANELLIIIEEPLVDI